MRKGFFSKLFLSALTLTSMNTVYAYAETKPIPLDINYTYDSARLAIGSLYNESLLSGYENGDFHPNKDITRAEFAAIMIRVLGVEDTGQDNQFADIKETDWYYDIVRIANQHGLLNGIGEDRNGNRVIQPNKEISRLEMILVLLRAKQSLDDSNTLYQEIDEFEVRNILDAYKDGKSVPNWAKHDIALALKHNIIVGVSENELGLEQRGSRAETAVFAKRILNEMNNKTERVTALDDNTVYVGQLDEHGNKNGSGKILNSSGVLIFKGYYIENKRFGYGREYSESGNLIYEGEYSNDQRQGYGITYYEDGNKKYIGDWLAGEYHGSGIIFYPSGNMKFYGNFVNGAADGKGVSIRDNGTIERQGTFSNGKLYGNGITYYNTEENGIMLDGFFVEGQLEGFGRYYDVNGDLIYEGDFKNGRPIGELDIE